MKMPFIGAAYSERSLNLDAQRCVNLYPVVDKEGGKNVIALYNTPGLKLFSQFTTTPVRGMKTVNNILYAVGGNTLYSIRLDGVATPLGTLLTDSGRVGIESNGVSPTGGNQIMVVDGPYGYIYNFGTASFSQITDAGFPGGDTVAFMDGYFIVNKPGTSSFQISALYDGTLWDALDIATAEADPDLLIAVFESQRQLLLFGDFTTEIWYDSGRLDFPFERTGTVVEMGLAARWSVVAIDNSVFILGQTKQGKGFVVRSVAGQPQIISTRAIEYQISTYPDISDAFAYGYTQEGHSFYVLTFTAGNATWVYDCSTGMWHERQQYVDPPVRVNSRHRGNTYAFFGGKHLIGDYQNGNIYEMRTDVYTDNGVPIQKIRASQHISSDLKIQFFHSLQVDMEMGVGDGSDIPTFLAPASNPRASLRWSDDGGHSWSNYYQVSLGRMGQKVRAVWRRLGRSVDRIFEVSIADPVKTVLIDAQVDITLGHYGGVAGGIIGIIGIGSGGGSILPYVEGGSAHTLALKSDGTVWAWGWNFYGQVGDGTTTERLSPVKVSGLTGIVSVSPGAEHGLALKSDGTVWAWGWNFYGQLGDGTYTNRYTPVRVNGLTGVIAISAGDEQSLALKSDGTVWAWGNNDNAQLGSDPDITFYDSVTPVQIGGLTGVIKISAGRQHCLALKSDGTVWAWGDNYYDQCGIDINLPEFPATIFTPVNATGLTGITAIAAGWHHSLALKSDGTVWAWGSNQYRQVGYPSGIYDVGDRYFIPVNATGLTGITAIAAGEFVSIALKSNGTVWTWGFGGYGQFGNGTTDASVIPLQATGLTDVVGIAGGESIVSAIKSDGTIWIWGDNSNGELGDGTTINHYTPEQLIF